MANSKKKKSEKSVEDKVQDSIKKNVKKSAKKTVKKAAKGNKQAIVAIVAVVIVIVVAAVALYFINPDIYKEIFSLMAGSSESEQGTTNSTTNGGTSVKPSEPKSDGTRTANAGITTYTINSGDLAMYMLDVGQGDCIYIEFPDGKDMIIDSGNANSSTFSTYNDGEAFANLETLVTDDTIDYLMVTHTDKDHVSFMDEVIDNYQINHIYMPNVLSEHENTTAANLDKDKVALFTDGDKATSGVYSAFFIAALTEPNCDITLNIGNYTISGSGWNINFFCLTTAEWTENTLKDAHEINAVSPIGILSCNGRKVVLTGDSNEENEPSALKKIKAFYGVDKLDCDILKVGHHGSETSSMTEFLDFFSCEYAMIGCNADGNTFEHPRYNTLVRLARRNMQLYRTDLNGCMLLTISSDGTISFKTEYSVDNETLWSGLCQKINETGTKQETEDYIIYNGEYAKDEENKTIYIKLVATSTSKEIYLDKLSYSKDFS